MEKVNRNVNKKANCQTNKNTTQKHDYKEIPSLAQKLRTKDLKETYKETVGFLNKTLKRNFRWQTPNTQEKINARVNEGFVLDDFKLVIEDRAREWKDDKKMKRYLRPETLFGTKMEGYVQEAKDNNSDDIDNLPNLMEE